MDDDLKLIKFKLIAELPNVPGATMTVVENCVDGCEAMHLARDVAWDLYGEYEDKNESIPSYDSLLEQYRSEWFDLPQNEFNQAIDDLYIRTVEKQIDYWVEEVEQYD